ncbi:MAG: NAD-dependent epimerase/dehydratase family protein [Bryobacteraceae bacterium]
MSVLVTGVAGFLASHVADALLAGGHDVVGLDDLSGGFRENVPASVHFYEGSILDRDLLARIFAQHQIRFVFHLAAYAAEGLSHFIRIFNYTNNVVGSMALLNEAVRAKVACFVFTSSIAVYGSAPPPIREDVVPAPEDPYGIAKRAVELDLEAAHRMFGINYAIFRPHNIYGERQNTGDRYRNVVGIFINQLLREEPMTIFGDGCQTRAFTYVGDVAPLLARVIEAPQSWNQIYNIGADVPVTVNDLAQIVAGAMNMPPNVRHVEARHEVKHAVADHSKLAAAFMYSPQWTLKDGLRRTADWAKTIGPRQPNVFQQLELDQNLPGIWRVAAER